MKKYVLFLFTISLLLIFTSCTQLTGLLGGTQTCTVHKDLNRDSVCDTCGAQIPVNCTSHTDKNHDGKCDTGGCSVELAVFHTDADHDGVCDGEECTLTFEVVHSDVNGDGECDICFAIVEKASCTTCIDADKDGKCDVCGSTVRKETCDECVDSDSNGKCDECGSKVAVKCECMDENFDGKCDKCKEKMENALIFADNGISPYSFVIANGLGSSTVKAVQKLIKELEALGVSGNEFKYERDSETEYEVLFGYVTQRGEDYAYNMYSLGMEGYAVEVIGKKIIVTAGSEETLSYAIDVFRTEFLGITSDTKTLKNRAIYESQGFAVIQDNYKITSVSIEGEDISGYTIAIDKNHLLSLNLARTVQTLFYQYTGYRPEIVDISESDKSIVFEMLPKSGNEGLYINVKSGELRISCEFESSFEVEVTSFFERVAGYSGSIASTIT